MIIAEIVGGLGNQLFQFAAAKALAAHHNVPLKLDISFYQKSHRQFELDNFVCKVELTSTQELADQKKNLTRNRFIKYALPPHKKYPFQEPYYHYYSNFLKAPSETYLKGLWQSEKYFISIKDTIKEAFTIKPALVSHLLEIAQEMQRECSVSIHIRRGDYLHPKNLNHFGLLSEEYYLKAISIVLAKHSNATIYFFSDDIEWVQKYITQKADFNYPHKFISKNVTSTGIEDFYLMQQCKHNIIANSTFSWWCAWLNKNYDKTIIAPKAWYNHADLNYKDLIPEKWLRV